MRSTWGSKREVSPGVWEIRYTIPSIGRKSETIRGSEKDADNRLATLRHMYCVTKEHVSDDVTISYLWEKVYWPTTEDLAPSTRMAYESYYRLHVNSSFGHRHIRSIRRYEVQSWLNGMTYGAARGAKATMRILFNFAEDQSYIKENIMRKRYKLPRKTEETTAQRHNSRVYTEREALAVLSDCKGEQWEAAFLLAVGGGLRRSEAFSPKLEEIEFAKYNGMIFALVPVVRSVQVISRKLIIREENKTEESAAVVVIAEPFSLRLKEIVDTASKGDIWLTDDGFGMPSKPTTIVDTYRRWFAYHKHEYVPFQNLRNSYSTIMHSKGLDQSVISKMMRHSNLKTDYKHYYRPTPKDFMETLSELGGENPPTSPKLEKTEDSKILKFNIIRGQNGIGNVIEF